MQKRSFVVLAAVTAVFVALAAAAMATGEPEASPVAADLRAFPGLAAKLGGIGSVGLQRHDFTATFVHKGDEWLVAQKGDYPADSVKVRRIVLALADLSLVEPKTREPGLYSRLEVADPGKGKDKATLVTVEDRSGATIGRLIVGKERYDRLGAGNDGVYVRKPGDAQSWLARGSLDLSGDLVDWLDRKILDIGADNIAKVTLTQPDGQKLVLSRAKPGAGFSVEGAPAGTKFKGAETIGEPAGALAGLDLTDVLPAGELPVPDKGVARASYTTFDGLTVDLRLFDHDKKDWVAVAAQGSGKAAAEAKKIDLRVAHWRYAIPGYKAQTLRTKLADLTEPAKPAKETTPAGSGEPTGDKGNPTPSR